ncbi:MAG: apolipoprotein N-acyltransferase [Syntrophobacterales bacterium]|nr:MAG: apolipoprotein N-acyltransferase [Syntrophobacterales bacterium]
MKMRQFLLACLSGLLLCLIFPKFDMEILAWVSLIPLLFAIRSENLLTSFYLGFITGFVSFLGILYWVIVAVNTYGRIHLILSCVILLLLVVYLSLYVGIFAFLLNYIRRRIQWKMVVVAPFLWITLEYVRSFFLTGFPWATLGYSQYLNLPLIQVADITGVYGISFLIVLINSAIYDYISIMGRGERHPSLREGVLVLAILFVVFGYGVAQIKRVENISSHQRKIIIGLAQGNIDQSIKWSSGYQEETLRIYQNLSLTLAREQPSLIIWPETATPFFFQSEERYRPWVLEVAEKTGAHLLFGSPSHDWREGKMEYYNSAYLLSPQKEVIGRYDKIHLVPFGERVPLSEFLFFLESLSTVGNLSPGRTVQNLHFPSGDFGVLICFEIIFPNLCRKFVKGGADFLVTITNDAWFGRTSAPYQHLSMAIFRAIENRVSIARAANTGISAFIDAKGEIRKRSGLFVKEALVGQINPKIGETFYTRYGDVFVIVSSSLVFLFVLLAYLKRILIFL